MLNMRTIFTLTLLTNINIFCADQSEVSGWEELLTLLLTQQSLQKHLVHSGASPLMRVNKTLSLLMDVYRKELRDTVWKTNKDSILYILLNNQKRINKIT